MFVIKRFASTGSPKTKLEEYFTYHTTNALLKPWIYRPKNANYLLTMDMKDPITNRPLQPRKPVAPLSRKILNDYIETISPQSDELVQWFKNWTSVTPRKRSLFNYISSEHIQSMLVNSFFRVGYYDEFLMNLYNNRPKFLKAGNNEAFDLEHYFNTVLMCKLHKNHLRQYKDGELAKKKLIRTWCSVTNYNNHTGLVNILVSVLAKQQGFEVQLKGLEEKDLVLPQLANIEDLNASKLLSFIQDNWNVYLISRTIEQFCGDVAVPAEINTFISNYQKAIKKLDKNDTYEEYIKSMESAWKPSGK